MYDENQLQGGLDALSAAFAPKYRQDGDYHDGKGWGQFLDTSPADTQTGPYGTCAGLVVLAAAGQTDLAGAHQPVVRLLEHWWAEGPDADGYRGKGWPFLQNLRLSFLLLAVRKAGLSALSEPIEAELLRRKLQDEMWGDWWYSETQHDQRRLVVPTAAALLALAHGRPSGSPIEVDLYAIAERLCGRLVSGDDLPSLHIALGLAAVYSVVGYAPENRVKRLANRQAMKAGTIADLGVYFYEYDRPRRDATGPDHDFVLDHDYFILPTAALFAIAGLQRSAPWRLRVQANHNVSKLLANIEANAGAYKPEKEQRQTSKNQAWVALALDNARRVDARGGAVGWALDWLGRRRDNVWVHRVVPTALLVMIFIASTWLGSEDPTYTKVAAAGGYLVAGWVYSMWTRS